MFTDDDRAQIIATVTPILEATLARAVQTAGSSTATTTWRPGTCVSATVGVARILVDGDAESIEVTVIGAMPGVGERVMVVFVPPSAVFAFAMRAGIVGPTAYDPTIDQGATANIARTINEARYVLDGPECEFWLDLSITAAGTAGGTVLIDLPFTPVGHAAAAQIGEAMYYDASTTTRYHGGFEISGAQVGISPNGAFGGLWGNTPSLAAASGDVIRGHGRYFWR